MMNEAAKMLMKKIYETGFALDDIVLFLDTHPNDPDAMNYYRCVAKMNQDAVSAYEIQFGPLMNNSVKEGSGWTWLENPWPWEGEV